ncbi:hypothetical protein NM897_10415 [Planococcus maritimus]|uniref:hypothetical protein n=1 Tax=Planococcus maritimus TaxID=192421 RepID=UPI003139900E
MSSSPMFIWVILSVIWIVLFLYVIDRMQKSKRSNESEMEKRIQKLEEENKKLNNEKNDS